MKTDLDCQLQVIAENIRWFRAARKMRQKDLASASGINHRYLQEYESGNQNLTTDSILKLSEALDISPCELNILSRIVIESSLNEFIEKNVDRLESFSIPVGIRNTERVLVYCNSKFAEICETEKSNLEGRPLSETMPEQAAANSPYILKFEKMGHSFFHATAFQGFLTQKIVHARALPICLFDTDKKYLGALTGLCTLEDMSQDKKSFHRFIMDVMRLEKIA